MLSIIIVHYDTAEELCDCLDSLQQIPPSVEVVVVDNHSPIHPERARKLVEVHPQMRWVDTAANLGFGGAAHVGVSEATGDNFLILNPDSQVLHANWYQFEKELAAGEILCADLVSPRWTGRASGLV